MTIGQGEPGTGGRSLLAAGMIIRGEIEAPGPVEISGTIEATIKADAVVVEPTGRVKGTITAPRVTIRGKVEGEIVTDELRIMSGAVVSGKVTTRTLSIEAGAEVDFGCHMIVRTPQT
jgi:cytoskeletal protein CcmA (bactofilin family)